MRFYLPFLAGVTAIALTACAPATPIVSDFNGDSVKIVQTNIAGEGVRGAQTDAEASRICSKGSKKNAEYASSRVLPTYEVEHLYLCL